MDVTNKRIAPSSRSWGRCQSWSCLAITTLLCLATIASAPAQQVEDVFFPAPREQRQRLSRAAQALEEGQYSEAVIALGELLSGEGEDLDGAHQDFFLGATSTTGTRESLKAKAQQMLGEMPSEGRKLYELRFGPQARALLESAINAGNHQQLVDITRRYFHTAAGYEATMLLGRRDLSEGRPLAAAMNFQRLTRWPVAVQRFDPQLSLMLATSWLQSGDTQRAGEVMLRLKQRSPNAAVRIAGKNVNLFSKDSDALTWLKQWSDGVYFRGAMDEEQWVMFRGNARRNASTKGDLPLLNERWRVPTVNDPKDENLVSEAKRQKRGRDLSTITSLHPLAVNGAVIMRTPDNLLAVEFETGRRIWEWPWRRGAEMQTSSKSGAPRVTELSRRLWDDASYGQMSSDGEFVYFLASQINTTPVVNRGGFMGGFIPAGSVSTGTSNELMCLSLRREGAIQWTVGGNDGGFEEELANAYFLGAPLPLQGRLYALVELKSEVRLVVLDPRTGKLLWQQQLAHLENNLMARSPQRRLAGASPSFSDGVLVCPTGAGAVVGLDMATRSLLWGYQYNSNFSNGRRIVYNRSPQVSADKWLDASPTIADKWVVLTPPESNELHCLELLTGKEASWSPVKRDAMLFVAAVADNRIVTVGRSEVKAIDIESGQPAWDPVKLGDGAPSGMGFQSDGFYYLPTTEKKILKIELATGKVVAEVETNRELGNLICYQNNVVSLGTEWCAAYYQRDFLRTEVDARLERNGNDEWALARRAELLLQDGHRDEALDVLRKTHKLNPDDNAIRVLLVETLLGILRTDFAQNTSLIDELEPLIDQPSQLNEFAKLKAVGLEKAGRIQEAFDAVIQLLPREGLAPDLEVIGTDLRVRRDRWVAARVASLTNSAEGDARKHIDDEVEKHLETALASSGTAALRRFVGIFGAHPIAREARLRLAEIALESKELLVAELQLDGIDEGEDEIAGRAVALRAKLLVASELPLQAAVHYRRLLDHWPSLALKEGLASEVAKNFLQQPESRPHRWPYGAVKESVASASPRRSTNVYQRGYKVAMEHTRHATSLTAVIDQRLNGLIIRDGMGQPRQTLPLSQGARYYTHNYQLTRGRQVGHLMLVNLGYELLAVDTARSGGSGILWRKSLVDSAPNGARATITQLRAVPQKDPFGRTRQIPGDMSNRVIPIAGPSGRNGVVYLKMRELICVDTITGDVIWSRNGLPAGSELLGDDELVIVAPPQGGEAKLLSAIDGEELGVCDVDSFDNTWTSWGRHRVTFKHDGTDVRIRLRDLVSGKTLWEAKVSRDSRGDLVDGDEFAICEPNGKLTVVSAVDGAVRLQAQVDAVELEHLQVLRSSKQYLVAVSGKQSVRTDGSVTAAPNNTFDQPLVNGPIYAFDRNTGDAVWQAPIRVQDYSLALEQPLESPLLLMVRNERLRSGGRSPQTFSAIAMDRRDGSLVFKAASPGTLVSYSVEAEPDAGVVKVSLNNRTRTYTLTNDPAPPGAPARVGVTSSSAAERARESIKRATDALFNKLPLP